MAIKLLKPEDLVDNTPEVESNILVDAMNTDKANIAFTAPKPNTVENYNCPDCNEALEKIYEGDNEYLYCEKCNKSFDKNLEELFDNIVEDEDGFIEDQQSEDSYEDDDDDLTLEYLLSGLDTVYSEECKR